MDTECADRLIWQAQRDFFAILGFLFVEESLVSSYLTF